MKALKVIGAIIAVVGVIAAAYFAITKFLCKKDGCSCEECDDIYCFDDDDEDEDENEEEADETTEE